MNFGSLFDNTPGGGSTGARLLSGLSYGNHTAATNVLPGGAMAQAAAAASLFSPPLTKSVYASSGLSLALVRRRLPLLPILIFLYLNLICVLDRSNRREEPTVEKHR